MGSIQSINESLGLTEDVMGSIQSINEKFRLTWHISMTAVSWAPSSPTDWMPCSNCWALPTESICSFNVIMASMLDSACDIPTFIVTKIFNSLIPFNVV